MPFLRVAPAFLLLFLNGAVLAQAPDDPARADTVSWTVAPLDIAKRPGHATLTLHGAVAPGWHVYSLKQLPEGPTPLVASVAANEVAALDGATTGSAPTKFHDPAFGLETQFYTGQFTLTLPVRSRKHREAPVRRRSRSMCGFRPAMAGSASRPRPFTCRPPSIHHPGDRAMPQADSPSAHKPVGRLRRIGRMPRSWPVLAISLAVALPVSAQIAVRNQGYIPYSDAPINYRSEDLSDPVALLEKQIEQGKVSLSYDQDHGYLKSVLELLKVPVESQTLVFSKTSFQYPKISPEHPRALYYNDDVYVGSVHEGNAIEIVSFDPRQGAIFYLLDERKVDKPVFQRAELDCTQCHIAAGTRGVPGVLLRSVFATPTGTLTPARRLTSPIRKAPSSSAGAAGM